MDNFDHRVVEETPRLQRYARSLTRNIDSANDLVQDTLLRALTKKDLWQEGTDLRAWLFTILHNMYVNGVRKAVRQGMSVDVEHVADMLSTKAHLEEKQLPPRRRLEDERTLFVLPEPAKLIQVVLPAFLLASPHLVGRPRDPSLRQRYATAVTELRAEGLEINITNLAGELNKKRKAVEAFLRKDTDLSNVLGITKRGLHDADDYRKAIEALVFRGVKATHENIGIELDLPKKGTVTHFLNEHPELRTEYPEVLAPRREPIESKPT